MIPEYNPVTNKRFPYYDSNKTKSLTANDTNYKRYSNFVSQSNLQDATNQYIIMKDVCSIENIKNIHNRQFSMKTMQNILNMKENKKKKIFDVSNKTFMRPDFENIFNNRQNFIDYLKLFIMSYGTEINDDTNRLEKIIALNDRNFDPIFDDLFNLLTKELMLIKQLLNVTIQTWKIICSKFDGSNKEELKSMTNHYLAVLALEDGVSLDLGYKIINTDRYERINVGIPTGSLLIVKNTLMYGDPKYISNNHTRLFINFYHNKECKPPKNLSFTPDHIKESIKKINYVRMNEIKKLKKERKLTIDQTKRNLVKLIASPSKNNWDRCLGDNLKSYNKEIFGKYTLEKNRSCSEGLLYLKFESYLDGETIRKKQNALANSYLVDQKEFYILDKTIWYDWMRWTDDPTRYNIDENIQELDKQIKNIDDAADEEYFEHQSQDKEVFTSYKTSKADTMAELLRNLRKLEREHYNITRWAKN